MTPAAIHERIARLHRLPLSVLLDMISDHDIPFSLSRTPNMKGVITGWVAAFGVPGDGVFARHASAEIAVREAYERFLYALDTVAI